MNTSLLRAIRVNTYIDGGPLRNEVFLDIMERSHLISFVYHIHKWLGDTFLSSMMVACYGLKSFFCVRVPPDSRDKIMCVARYSSEKKQVSYVRKCMGSEELREIGFNFALRDSVKSIHLSKYIFRLGRFYRIVRRLNLKYEFLPACRASSLVGYYLRFYLEFLEKQPQIILVASNHSPEGAAALWCAHSLGIPRVYVQHSCLPVKGKVPPLDCDLSILEGSASLDAYLRHGSYRGRVVFKGKIGNWRELDFEALRSSSFRVGVFLTALLNKEVIGEIVEKIFKQLRPTMILVRPHPDQIVTPDLDGYLPKGVPIEISKQRSLMYDVNECDLVIAGNSGVHIEVLKYGTPTIFMSGLDTLPEDYFGFVAKQIVYCARRVEELSIDKIISFYGASWAQRFRDYDAAYMCEEFDMIQGVRNAILELAGRRSMQ